MDPANLVEVACACEAQDLVKQEAIMAELRYRNILLIAQSYFHILNALCELPTIICTQSSITLFVTSLPLLPVVTHDKILVSTQL
jgi:hypothetical protein